MRVEVKQEHSSIRVEWRQPGASIPNFAVSLSEDDFRRLFLAAAEFYASAPEAEGQSLDRIAFELESVEAFGMPVDSRWGAA